MEVTVVSHAGIANRIKNLLSAMAQYDKVYTPHDTISFIFPETGDTNFTLSEFLS